MERATNQLHWMDPIPSRQSCASLLRSKPHQSQLLNTDTEAQTRNFFNEKELSSFCWLTAEISGEGIKIMTWESKPFLVWNPKSCWAKRNAKSFTRVPVLIMSRSFAFCICSNNKKGGKWEEKMEEKSWEAAAAAVARPRWVLSLGVSAGRHSNLLTSSALYYSKTLLNQRQPSSGWVNENQHQ